MKKLFGWCVLAIATCLPVTVHAQTEIECAVGTIRVKATPDACAKLGGTPVAPAPESQPVQASADQLFGSWDQQRRIEHEKASAAGKEFVARHPDDPRAAAVRSWIDAYAKAVGGTGVGKTGAPAAAAQDQELEETKRWLERRYTITDQRVGQRLSEARFDKCTLIIESYLRWRRPGGLFRSAVSLDLLVRRHVPFEKVDPASIRLEPNGGGSSKLVVESTFQQKAFRVEFFELKGTPDRPEAGDKWNGVLPDDEKTAQSWSDTLNNIAGGNYRSPLASRWTPWNLLPTEIALREASAIELVARQCGGKVTPF